MQLKCTRVLHETLFVPILMYSSETVIWKEKKRSSIRAVHMDNLTGLLGIRRMDKVPIDKEVLRGDQGGGRKG